jgi:uncharacterized membrane protein YdjX (TVP38/TMEM64 family)
VRLRWALLAVLLLALILVPFTLFEESLTRWAHALLRPENRPWAAGAVALLLTLDVLLPIPSSMVSTAAGSLLGFWGGMLASTAGMTVGSFIGYGLGRVFGPEAVSRFVGEEELARVSRAWERHGDWAVVLFRAVPVLAEASVVLAGMARMPVARFLLWTAAANLCVSAVYAAASAYAVTGGTFLLAFAAAVLLPFAAILFAKRRGA